MIIEIHNDIIKEVGPVKMTVSLKTESIDGSDPYMSSNGPWSIDPGGSGKFALGGAFEGEFSLSVKTEVIS